MISVWQHGFALINALIFGKIILIAQALEVGKSLERRALLWIVLGKSLILRGPAHRVFTSLKEPSGLGSRVSPSRRVSPTSEARCLR
jgi:hypothetical protein